MGSFRAERENVVGYVRKCATDDRSERGRCRVLTCVSGTEALEYRRSGWWEDPRGFRERAVVHARLVGDLRCLPFWLKMLHAKVGGVEDGLVTEIFGRRNSVS